MQQAKKVMENPNKELIEKTTSVLDKIMAFFRKVVVIITITDKCVLHHKELMDVGIEVWQDEALSTPAQADEYVTAKGEIITVMLGKVIKITGTVISLEDEFGIKKETKFAEDSIKAKIETIKAKLHAQNIVLNNARLALEEANARLKKT